jgi:hypothetical protein
MAPEVANKTKLEEVGREKVNCIHLVQRRVKWRTLDVPQKSMNFLPSSTTTGFSRRVLLHGGIKKNCRYDEYLTKYEANYFPPFCVTIKFVTLGWRLRPAKQ